jgi:hypothetical protein
VKSSALGYSLLVIILAFCVVEFLRTNLPLQEPARWHRSDRDPPDEVVPVFTFSLGAMGTPTAGVMYRFGNYWYAWRIPRRELIEDIKPRPAWWIEFPQAAGL